MMETPKQLFETLNNFSSISLEQLNSSVSFLDRIDVKYLVHVSQLPELIAELKDEFDVLNIKNNSVFSYDNVYMDTNNYLFYRQHEGGETFRTKVRTRHYVDAGDLAFFEYKQKEKGMIRKFRYECGLANHGIMTDEAMKYYEGVWTSMYGESPQHLIFPSVGSQYNRFTLCSKSGEERLTIDFNLKVIELRGEEKGKVIELPNVAIIESKSTSKNCKSAELMAAHDISKAKSCSKYSLGVYYLGHAETWSRFQHSIDVIESMKKTAVDVEKRPTVDFLQSQVATPAL